MTELTGHPVYRLLETKYDECQLDIVVLQPDGPYEGRLPTGGRWWRPSPS